VIYDTSALVPAQLRNIEALATRGEQARTMSDVPIKLVIADRQGPGGADCHTVREPHRAQGRHGIAATGQQRRQPTQPASRPSHGELGRLRPVGSHRSATAANDRRPSQRHEGPRLTRRVRSTRRQGGPGAQRKYLSSTPLVDRRRHCWRAGGRRPWCSPRWLRELAPFNTTDSNMRLYR